MVELVYILYVCVLRLPGLRADAYMQKEILSAECTIRRYGPRRRYGARRLFATVKVR